MRISDWSSDVCSSYLPSRVKQLPSSVPFVGPGPGKTRAWREARSLEPRLGNEYEGGVLRPDRCLQASLITFQGARPSCRAFVYVVTAADRKRTRLNSSH